MTNRSKHSQGKHDRRVRELASELKTQGWRVEADINGYTSPKPIGKDSRIPDIVAEKRRVTRLIEVETPESLIADKDQHTTFSRSAAQRPRTTFNIEVT